MWAVMIAAAIGRIILNKATPRLLKRPRTRVVWRSTFAFLSMLFAASWGAGAVYLITREGLSVDAFKLQVACFGVCAVAIPAFAYDLAVLLAFQFFVIAPIAFTNGHIYGFLSEHFIGDFLFLFFMSYVAVHMHRFMINNMHQVEVISGLHNTLNTMVNSVDEAFLTIGPDGRFGETQSARAQEMFGTNPSGRDLREILRLPTSQHQEISDWLKVAFAGQVDFDTVASLGPSRFQDGAKTIALRYRPMSATAGKPAAVVMVAADISREVAAEKSAKKNLERAEMILQALKDPAGFNEFLADTKNLFTQMREGKIENSAPLMRELHNLKGGAGLMHMPDLVHAVHSSEKVLRLGANASEEGKKLVHALEKILEEERDLVSRLKPSTAPRTLQSYLRGLGTAVDSTSAKLGKKVRLVVESQGRDLLLNETPAYLKTFVHLLNNAVDHGIELPAERLERGKPECGTIQFICEEQAGNLRIRVIDDGGGIQLAGLRKALLKTRPESEIPLSETALLDTIFEDRVSSREQATEISGHGVGMAAVRSALRQAGGDIRIVSSNLSGTEFEILVPIPGKSSKAA